MTTLAFVVSGGHESAMGFRARDLAARLPQFDIRIAYRSPRKLVSILSLFNFLVRVRPVVSYVFDISYSGVLSAGLYRIVFGNCLIIETGDAIVELVRSTGSRGKLRLWLTRLTGKHCVQDCRPSRRAGKFSSGIGCRGAGLTRR